MLILLYISFVLVLFLLLVYYLDYFLSMLYLLLFILIVIFLFSLCVDIGDIPVLFMAAWCMTALLMCVFMLLVHVDCITIPLPPTLWFWSFHFLSILTFASVRPCVCLFL